MSYLYRFSLFGHAAGDWHRERELALADAIDAGYAKKDSRYRRTFLIVPAEIEACEERDVAPEDRPQDTE